MEGISVSFFVLFFRLSYMGGNAGPAGLVYLERAIDGTEHFPYFSKRFGVLWLDRHYKEKHRCIFLKWKNQIKVLCFEVNGFKVYKINLISKWKCYSMHKIINKDNSNPFFHDIVFFCPSWLGVTPPYWG